MMFARIVSGGFALVARALPSSNRVGYTATYDVVKRQIDIALAGVLLLALAPLMVLISILVAIFMGFPVIFRQARSGLNTVPFNILKFRTMLNPTAGDDDRTRDEERLTRLGRTLRAFSLDELPQLINILKGDMSFVGPRPLLMKYLDRYTPNQMRRHDVRPGLTGWAQVNGRNAVDWRDRLAMDVWYVENRSFRLDLFILLKTFWVVFLREGVSEPGHATKAEFKGGANAPSRNTTIPWSTGPAQSRGPTQ